MNKGSYRDLTKLLDENKKQMSTPNKFSNYRAIDEMLLKDEESPAVPLMATSSAEKTNL